jgi:pimeloyl-ACP methyl ester carboxylesterase
VRPRLLLIPEFTELQWTIRPKLGEWADVRSFDPPGVGEEPRPAELAGLTRQVLVDRAIEEIDHAGWDGFYVAADGWSVSVAVRLAMQRPEAVQGVALGHAALSSNRSGPRAPINGDLYAAMNQLIENDAPAFIRYAIVQSTAGSIDEDVAEQMMGRIPAEDIGEGWALLTAEESWEEEFPRLELPVLLAKHQGCLMNTDEGFEDAAAALPKARAITVPSAPCTSPEFADALRSFCLDAGAEPSSG